MRLTPRRAFTLDWLATCWSIYKHYFADEGNAYAYDMEDIAAYYDCTLNSWRTGANVWRRIYDLSYES